MLAWYEACLGLGREIHQALAVDLGLEPGFFDDKLDRLMATLRAPYSPAAPGFGHAGVRWVPASTPTTAT